ncbi:MAG TPA: tail fiber protein [Pyrinomonadaceae bacterium]|nr:tail fiber protein [Pyrinomonadaceae bacterium]
MDEFIAIIKMFGGNFAPRGWALCNGQILSIAQNTALFSLLGTTFGGNGQTTFALPDLRGRVPVHPGQGPGLSPYNLGQASGTENTTLTINNMPQHNHPFQGHQGASTNDGNDTQPGGNLPAIATVNVGGTDYQVTAYRSGAQPDAQLAGLTGTVGIAGGSQPFSILQPYLCVNFIICLEGIFPSRN